MIKHLGGYKVPIKNKIRSKSLSVRRFMYLTVNSPLCAKLYGPVMLHVIFWCLLFMGYFVAILLRALGARKTRKLPFRDFQTTMKVRM